MYFFKIIFIFFFVTLSYADTTEIKSTQTFDDLLANSSIYIDNSKNLTLNEVKKLEFKQNDKVLLSYGYSPNFNVWIKFTIKNTTNKSIHKIIEYDSALTTNVNFYNIKDNTQFEDGFLTISKDRKTINPIFKIELKANESKTFYIKASSYVTTLIIKLNLWAEDEFYQNEFKHQLILGLFFGAMMILAFYNLFIYFFTKDIAYLFYVLYLLGIVIHHTLYTGIISVYILDEKGISYILKIASVFTLIPVLGLALFSKNFIQIKQYPIFNKILNTFLILVPVYLIIFLSTDSLNTYRNIFTMLFLLFLIIVTIYSAYKRNRQSYFILFGWIVILIGSLLMYFSSVGLLNTYSYYPYLVEISFVLEAVIFSIALADKINYLQYEKEEVHKKLLTQQENEKQRLEIKVKEKTADLEIALKEKGLLLKELNHRVKNNMQTILSLIRLQNDDIEDEKLQNVILTIQNRISAMSHLHELLYKEEDKISNVNAYEYFDLLVKEINFSYTNDINIIYNIKTDLEIQQAVYCGLILNELITNSFKYAFPEGKGNINITLDKVDNTYILEIQDDGIGYKGERSSSSLGLILVDTLVKQQLKGKILIQSNQGVKVNIMWRNHEEN